MAWEKKASTNVMDRHAFPLVVEPNTNINIIDFVTEYQDDVKMGIAEYGAILFRGFNTPGESALSDILETIWAKPLAYVYRSTPRTSVGKGIYTATEYPATRHIPPHCESAYQLDWPMIIGFHCVEPSQEGGQTPIGDVSSITNHIGNDILAEFRERRVRYVRNYSDKVDLPWNVVFQTESKQAVEQYCKDHHLSFEWKEGRHLRTSQVCQGTAIHPTTNEELWFNQSHLFHVSSLGDAAAKSMIEVFGEDNLPRHSYFGDGASIPSETLGHVRESFSNEMFFFDWAKDDILVLDNMRVCHARRPYVGQRRVLAAMGVPFSEASRSTASAS